MGCETSELLKENLGSGNEEEVTEEDIELRTQNIIDRQRGDVM